MDFLVDSGSEAAKRVNFENFPAHLVKDLLIAMHMGKNDGNSTDASDLSSMPVSDLRKMLQDKGLDIDGSKEAMLARLEKCHQTKMKKRKHV